ncbi:hypothetical protein [Frischella perrara]|uniref:hypothetical protein n=1 Tax=Frischella perrara TaxID=1267021 RepID=UPI0023F038B3|nr:hypothetical protein [Frischella perrara]MCT6875594.1 hypothetical protein [Frischella perrara]
MKKYNKAPLPFQGQKRNFLKIFNRELEKLCGDGDGWIIIDVFGGSGLLAHNAKYTCRKARVLFNDYDNYTERLLNINKTDQLRRRLRKITGNKKRCSPLNIETKNQVINYLKNCEYIDYMTLSGYLLFSGNYFSSIDELESHKLYDRVSKYPPNADGYLSGVETVHKSFTEILSDDFKGKVLYLLDPPYINTMQGYHRDKSSYFGLLSQLALFELMKPPFFYFTSNRSEIMDFVENPSVYSHVFENCEIFTTTNSPNGRSTYLDILIKKVV